MNKKYKNVQEYAMSKIILFVSAFVPMYILFLINLIVEIMNNNLTWNVTNTCVLVALIILTLISTIELLVILKINQKTYKTIKVLSKKNITDQHFLNYFSLFVLLALTFDLSKLCFVSVFVVILIFIGIVYIKNNIFYVNPLLNILGYSFYDIEYTDGSDEPTQLRIFFKGTLDISKQKYELCVSNRNLNFLRKKN